MTTEQIKEHIQSRVTITPTGCWNWNGALGGFYPAFEVNGKRINVRRMCFAIYNRPPGRCVISIRTTCHNQRCVNPAHLMIKLKRKGGRKAY
jgi:hypothetical protein